MWLKIGNEAINVDSTIRLIELEGKRIMAYGNGPKACMYEGRDEADAKEQYDLLMQDLKAINGDRLKLERLPQ